MDVAAIHTYEQQTESSDAVTDFVKTLQQDGLPTEAAAKINVHWPLTLVVMRKRHLAAQT